MGKLLMVLCFLSLNASGQTRPVSFEDLSRLQAKEARPVFVLITTGWCKYCHAMKTMLLRHKTVSQLMEDKFYLVFMDAEEKKDILFAGKLFRNKTGIHELALELGIINGQISFPSFCILNDKNEIIYQHAGYIGPKEMILIYNNILP
jgi:thioredoxin-related protein